MNAPMQPLTSAKDSLIAHRDTALDRLHRMPEGWTRDLLVMAADIANRVARYPANSEEEREQLAASQATAATVCARLLKTAETCAILEAIEPADGEPTQ